MRRSSRHGQRGSALVLAIFILFAMLALGMLAMRTATQNVSGSGNLRLNKQARFIAEAGLYHAMTLLQRDGANLVGLRDAPGLEDGFLVVESPRGEGLAGQRSEVLVLDQNEVVRNRVSRPAPGFLNEGPSALGVFGDASGLTASYRVVISGFQPWACPPGFDENALKEQGEGCCLMHFESRGYIADAAVPTEEELAGDIAAERFAEHGLKAGAVMGPYSVRGCQR